MNSTFAKILSYVVLIVGLIFFFFPFVILLINAFKTNSEIVSSPLALPTSISFDQFALAMEQMKYWASFKNSTVITFGSLFVILLCSAMTAHYFVRNKTKGNTFWFMAMVASMIIPFQSIMIPRLDIWCEARLDS